MSRRWWFLAAIATGLVAAACGVGEEGLTLQSSCSSVLEEYDLDTDEGLFEFTEDLAELNGGSVSLDVPVTAGGNCIANPGWTLGLAISPDGTLSTTPQPDAAATDQPTATQPDTSNTTATEAAADRSRIEVVGRLDGAPMGLSPDGSRIATADREDSDELCFFDLPSASLDFCVPTIDVNVDAGEQLARAGDFMVWSPDSTNAVFSASVNRDLSMIDFETGSALNINDDGLWDMAEEGRGVAPTDFFPVWLDDSTVAFVQRTADTSEANLVIYDFDSRAIVREIRLPTKVLERIDREVSRFDYPTVLAVDSSRAMLVGDGAVFDIDVDSGTVVEVVDFSQNYKGEAPNFAAVERGALVPLALLSPTQLLVRDQIAQFAVGNATDSGVTSGLLIIDLESGALTDVFARSGLEGGWIGPTDVAIDPATGQWLVWWLDSTVRHDDLNAAVGQLSVLDADTADYPVNPRDLALVYSDTQEDALTFGASNASTFGLAQTITDDGLFAAMTIDGDTLILRLI